jgi:hypothetical protein
MGRVYLGEPPAGQQVAVKRSRPGDAGAAYRRRPGGGHHAQPQPCDRGLENGSAEGDVLSADGQIHDPDRIEYLRDHMAAVANAVAEGVDVRGYYVWSLIDNYEWAFGYDRRFGIVHVDYDTMRRTPKDSYRWYQQLIAAKA